MVYCGVPKRVSEGAPRPRPFPALSVGVDVGLVAASPRLLYVWQQRPCAVAILTEHPSPSVPSQHRATAAVQEATYRTTLPLGRTSDTAKPRPKTRIQWDGLNLCTPLLSDRIRFYITVHRMKGCFFFPCSFL